MRHLALILAIAFSGTLFAAVPRLKPLNPAFCDWTRRRGEMATNVTARASGIGEIGGLHPSPMDFSYLPAAYRRYRERPSLKGLRLAQLGAAALPSRWDSRDVDGENWITPVGAQGISGPCWAFATIACLETALIKNGAGTYDLSENHLATHSASPFSWKVTGGGNINMATALTTAWSDPLLESQDPYQQGAASTNGPPVFHVQDAVWIPARTNETDNAELKRAVMEYGAVMIGYGYYSGYGHPTTGAYYYNGSSGANHGVAVVGWDDDYAVENFVSSHRPPTPGAFLIKNSWGDDASYTTNGYSWISYCDTTFADSTSLAFPIPEATNNFSRVYQYDPCGCVSSFGLESETAWAANLFTATVTGVVDAVGFYALSPGTAYEVSVYTNCASSKPTSGGRAIRMTGEYAQAGFQTLRLSSGVALERAGERFSVVIKLTTPELDYPQAIEYAYGGYCTATANAGESFYSENGTSWDDLYEWDSTANFCIKAYARTGADGPEPRAATTLHVDAESTAENPDGSLEKPFASIGAAIAVSQADDEILVAPGTYVECVVAPSHAVTIRSSEGPSETIIDADSVSRCYTGASTAFFTGFTLRNGAASYGGGVYGGVVSNCVIVNCQANCGGGASAATLLGSTVYGNVAWESGGGVDADCVCTNSIVYFNYCDKSEKYDNWESYRSSSSPRAKKKTTQMRSSCTYPTGFTDKGGSTTNDPAFVNLELDDWRLRSGSPCLGTATDGGNMGVYQGDGLEGHLVTVTRHGKGEVVPETAFIPLGESVTFTATSPYHVFGGFETNGVLATRETTFEWSNLESDGALAATFLPTNFHVSASRPDDAGDGLTWETARQSLSSAVTDAGEGDVVFVAPGVYGPVLTEEPGFTIVSTGGVAAAVIDGGGTTRCVTTYYTSVCLKGFTLRNGRATGSYGGGLYGGTLVNSVVSNCSATAGGGVAYAYLTNCLVVKNSAARYGGGLYDCEPSNCTVADNYGGWYGGGAFLEEGYLAFNTSFATNICAYGYDNGNDVYGMGFHTMTNCLVDTDARYVDQAHGDYRLAANSPCLDAGRSDLADATARDLAGTNRVIGGAVDIGCYEYAHVPDGWPDPGIAAGDTPAVQAEKIASSLVSAGFSAETAARVTTYAGYVTLTGWAEAKGIAAGTLAQASTALLSPALWAETILELTSDDLHLGSFAATADGGWSLSLSLDAYDAARVNADLLKAAVGIVGADRPDGTYSDRDLTVSVEPQSDHVDLTVMPPAEVPGYFFRGAVR